MSTARAVSRPSSPQRRSPVLRLIPGGISRSPKAPFVALVVTVLAVGLLGLLVLNTALRQGAIELSEAEADNAQLRDDVTMLSEEVATREAPGSLAQAAEELGMVPAEDPVFLDVGSVTESAGETDSAGDETSQSADADAEGGADSGADTSGDSETGDSADGDGE